MKTFLFATLAATLLTASSAFAAPLASPGYPPFDHGHDAYNGYNQAYRPDYRAHDYWDHGHWDEGHRDAPRYDREQAYGYERSQNYGYAQNQNYRYAREQSSGYSGNQNYGYNQGQNYGYDRDQRVIVQPQPQQRRPAVSFQLGIY